MADPNLCLGGAGPWNSWQSCSVLWAVFTQAITLLLTLILAPDRASGQTAVDLEIVLSVDASDSVDDQEYALQIGGIANAFRDPSVTNAIAKGELKSIAVSLVIWADANAAKDLTDWWVIDSTGDAFAFAIFVEQRPRLVKGGMTGIGAGVAAAIQHLESNDIVGRRTVIDISGDGTDNTAVGGYWSPVGAPYALARARENAEARGITINGLAILNDIADLDDWYRQYVRVGAKSFVLAADDYGDFAQAILAKLLREIGSGPAVSDNLRPAGAPARLGLAQR